MWLTLAALLGMCVRAGEFAEAPAAFNAADDLRSVHAAAGAVVFAPSPEEGWQAPFEATATAAGEALLLAIESPGRLRLFPEQWRLGKLMVRTTSTPWQSAPEAFEALAGYDALAILGDAGAPEAKLQAARQYILCGGAAILSLEAAHTLLAGTGIAEAGAFAAVLKAPDGNAWAWRGGRGVDNLLLVDAGRLTGRGGPVDRAGLERAAAEFLEAPPRPLAAPAGRVFAGLHSEAAAVFGRRGDGGELRGIWLLAGVVLLLSLISSLPWRRRLAQWLAAGAAFAAAACCLLRIDLPPELVRAGVFYMDAAGRVSGGIEYIIAPRGGELAVSSACPCRPVARTLAELMLSQYTLDAQPGRYRLLVASAPAAVQLVRTDAVGRAVALERQPRLDEHSGLSGLMQVLWEASPGFPTGIVTGEPPFAEALEIRLDGRPVKRIAGACLYLSAEEPRSAGDAGN